MVAISFLIMKKKVVSGEKTQTIREKKTNHWLRFSEGYPVEIYWKQQSPKGRLLFKSKLREDPFVIKWKDFTEELAIRDGFKSLEEANRDWFIPKYGENGRVIPEKKFVVLRWYSPVDLEKSRRKSGLSLRL